MALNHTESVESAVSLIKRTETTHPGLLVIASGIYLLAAVAPNFISIDRR